MQTKFNHPQIIHMPPQPLLSKQNRQFNFKAPHTKNEEFKPKYIYNLLRHTRLYNKWRTHTPRCLGNSLKTKYCDVRQKIKSDTYFWINLQLWRNILSAHQTKTKKYIDLKRDLIKDGWTTNLVPFEKGSRGQVTKNNKKSETWWH